MTKCRSDPGRARCTFRSCGSQPSPTTVQGCSLLQHGERDSWGGWVPRMLGWGGVGGGAGGPEGCGGGGWWGGVGAGGVPGNCACPGLIAIPRFRTHRARGGPVDFSQTSDTGGRLLAIRDPSNGSAQFPGKNVITANRINSQGQGLLRVLPSSNSRWSLAFDRRDVQLPVFQEFPEQFSRRAKKGVSLRSRLDGLTPGTSHDTISVRHERLWRFRLLIRKRIHGDLQASNSKTLPLVFFYDYYYSQRARTCSRQLGRNVA